MPAIPSDRIIFSRNLGRYPLVMITRDGGGGKWLMSFSSCFLKLGQLEKIFLIHSK